MTDFLTGSDQKPDLKMALAYLTLESTRATVDKDLFSWLLLDIFDIPPGKIVEAARKLASQ